MIICPNCNNENEDSEEYCVFCGSKLDNSTNVVKSPDIFTSQINDNISTNETLNSYYKELKDKINNQEEKLKNLQNDPLFEKHDELFKVEEENNSLKSQINSLNDEIDKLKDNVLIDDLNAKIRELESLNKSYIEANKDLHLKMTDLRKENDEIGSLRVKVEKLEVENKTLKDKLEKTSQKEKVIIICPNCKFHHTYKSDLNFCTECGYPLK